MRKCLMILVACIALCTTTAAANMSKTQADLFGISTIPDELYGRAAQLMEPYDPAVQADFADGIVEIINDAVSESGVHIKSTLSVMIRILIILVMCRFWCSLGENQVSRASRLVGALAVTACCMTDIHSMIGLGTKLIEEIDHFTMSLLPVIASATAAAGGPGRGGAIYAVTAVFCDILIRVCRSFLIPMLYAYLALGLADTALEQCRLTKMKELIGWVIKTVLKSVLYLFTGFLATTGVISGASDAAAIKTAKFAISGMVPVVGSIVSDASESLLAGAGLLKSSLGTFGMLAILAIFLYPFLRLGIYYLGFKVTSALGGMLGSEQEKLLDTITGSMGYVLGMVGSCTAISMIACCCFVKVATP